MQLFKSQSTVFQGLAVNVLVIAVLTASASADQVVAKSGGGVKRTTGRVNVPAAGPVGSWFRNASATDSAAAPKTVQAPPPRTGPYPTPIVAGGGIGITFPGVVGPPAPPNFPGGSPEDTGQIDNPGIVFHPSARGCLSYGPGFYDTSCTDAAIFRLAFVGVETAVAAGVAVDPSEYTVQFDPNSPTEVEFSLTFPEGMNLLAVSDSPADTSSYASLAGFDETDLLSGLLWSFAWSADSANPDSSLFVFQSHPALGLDDAAIMLEFLSNVTSSNGEHVLGASVVVTGVVDVELAEGEDELLYTFGGETTATAGAAAGIPEPGTWLLFVLGFTWIADYRTTRKQHKL
jgi:hypothetical protein